MLLTSQLLNLSLSHFFFPLSFSLTANVLQLVVSEVGRSFAKVPSLSLERFLPCFLTARCSFKVDILFLTAGRWPRSYKIENCFCPLPCPWDFTRPYKGMKNCKSINRLLLNYENTASKVMYDISSSRLNTEIDCQSRLFVANVSVDDKV